jgi:hypothetical protein
MSLSRRIRGLVGTALTWGGIGALIGLPAFIVVMRPWPLSDIRWQRFFDLLARWETVAFVWGAAGGLVFAIAFLALERSRRLSQLSLARVAVWGALAGGALPAILVGPGLTGSNPAYYGAIIGAGALCGAIWARMSLAIARRGSKEPEVEFSSRAL